MAPGRKLAMAAAAAAAAAAALPFAAAQTAVIVGGEFTEAGGVATQNLAQWNGNAWSRLNGPPMADGIVWSLATYQGKLVAAGRYNQIGTETFKNIAQFDGYQWAPLGTGIELVLVPPYTADVRALTVYRDQLIAGGLFDTAGGVLASGAAAWDGASWSALGEGVNNEIFALAVYNDALYAGGEFFTAGGSTARYIAKWDGAAWSPLGEGITTQGGKVYALLVYDGALIVGGEFESAGNVPASNIARWDGSAWSALGGGVTSPVGPFAPSVNSLTIFQGDLVLAGRFQGAEGQSLNRIARWNGTAYSPMGDGFNDEVNVVIAYEDTVIAGGRFGQSGSKDIYQIASWDGAEWHDMGFQDEYISYTWFHAMVLVSAADACSLAGPAWRAQYTDAAGVLVEDVLQFQGNASFAQTLTAFPHQACGTANQIRWTGSWQETSPTDLVLSYGTCTPSTGCLSCGSAGQVALQFKFSEACDVLTILAPDAEDPRTYYPLAK